MAIDATSTVRITADTRDFSQNIEFTKDQVAALNSGFSTLKSAALSVASAMVTAAGVQGIGAMIMRSMELQDNLAKTADRLGVTTKTLSAFHLQANLSGVGAENFDRSLEKMTLGLQDAARGTGPAGDAIKDLGLDIYDLASQSPDKAFFEIAAAMQSMETETQKLNIAADIFGNKSTYMVNMINEGRAGFEAAAKQTEFFGTAISRIDASKLEAANDAITKMKESTDGLATRIGIRLAPILEQLADNFARNTVEVAKFLGFRTEEEELNNLYNERKDIIERLITLDRAHADDPVLRKRLEAVRAEIKAMEDKRKAETEAFNERERQRAIEAEKVQESLRYNASMPNIQNAVASANIGSTAKNSYQDQEMSMLQGKLEQLKQHYMSEEDLLSQSLENKKFLIEESFQNNLITDQERYDLLLNSEQEYQDGLNAIADEAAKKRAAIEQRYTDIVNDLKSSTFNHAIQLLGALGGKNETAAKMAIVLQKGMAIAQIKMQSAVAAMAALSPPPIGLGPVAGQGLAASIRGWAAADIGMVAGLGMLELSNVNSGGGGGSAGAAASNSGSPGSVASSGALSPMPQQREGSVNIYIQGPSNEQFILNEVVPMIQEVVENRDVILIRSDSRNGQIFRD